MKKCGPTDPGSKAFARNIKTAEHKPKAVAARFVKAWKKQLGRGTQVCAIKAEATALSGWDYGFYGLFEITLADGAELRAAVSIHYDGPTVRDFNRPGAVTVEASGNVTLDAAYGGVVGLARGSSWDQVEAELIRQTGAHLAPTAKAAAAKAKAAAKPKPATGRRPTPGNPLVLAPEMILDVMPAGGVVNLEALALKLTNDAGFRVSATALRLALGGLEKRGKVKRADPHGESWTKPTKGAERGLARQPAPTLTERERSTLTRTIEEIGGGDFVPTGAAQTADVERLEALGLVYRERLDSDGPTYFTASRAGEAHMEKLWKGAAMTTKTMATKRAGIKGRAGYSKPTKKKATKKATKPAPRADQMAALRKYRAAVGDDWKAELSRDWFQAGSRVVDADTYALLHQLRNSHGPSWLVAFQPNGKATKAPRVWGAPLTAAAVLDAFPRSKRSLAGKGQGAIGFDKLAGLLDGAGFRVTPTGLVRVLELLTKQGKIGSTDAAGIFHTVKPSPGRHALFYKITLMGRYPATRMKVPAKKAPTKKKATKKKATKGDPRGAVTLEKPLFEVYYTVLVPYSDTPTKWHPQERSGPLSVISRGAFPKRSDAVQWAQDNLRGNPYSIRDTPDVTRPKAAYYRSVDAPQLDRLIATGGESMKKSARAEKRRRKVAAESRQGSLAFGNGNGGKAKAKANGNGNGKGLSAREKAAAAWLRSGGKR